MMWPDSHVVNLLTMPRCLSAQSKFTLIQRDRSRARLRCHKRPKSREARPRRAAIAGATAHPS